jgi:hypothetical protein
MTIAHAYMLLLEAAVLVASFGILWLSFWLRDRRRPNREMQAGERSHRPLVDLASEQQDGAKHGPLVIGSVASGARRAIDLASSDVQPASEKDKAVLYRSEYAQYFSDEPQIEAEQEQRAQFKPMKSDPVIHRSTSPEAA